MDSASTRIVRVNWLKFLFYSWKRISILSKLIVSCQILLTLVQVIAGIVVLVLAKNESCDQPLKIFIIVYIVRIAISCPFYVGQHFVRAEESLRAQRQRERDLRREEQVRLRRRNRHASTGDTASLAQSTVIEPQPNRVTALAERFRTLVELFAVVWFIVGNYLLFNSQTCSRVAPRLYYMSLVYVLIGYLIVIIPVFLCTSAVFCLPCVLFGMRIMNIQDFEGMDQGGDEEEISKIPVYRFRVTAADNATSEGITTQPSSKKQRNIISRLLHGQYRSRQLDKERGTYDEIFITPAEDALCCICLSEYEDEDILCRLWCGHHFHRSCLTEWLSLNRKCPLCKQDFRGKEYNRDEEEEEEEEEEEMQEQTQQSAPITTNTNATL